MENKMIRDAENDEIDLLRLFMVLKQNILLIIAVGLLGGLLSGLYTHFMITPTYKATTSMLVLTKETTLASLADLEIGSKLTNDYTELINSRTVLENVIKNLNLDMEYTTLRDQISISNPDSTRILKITVTQADPVMAKKVADEVATVSSKFIEEQMEVTPPKIYETSEVPIYKDSPNMKKNVMLGLLAGMVLVAGVEIVLELLNDSIQTEDDVVRYLDIPVLSAVPDKDKTGKKKKQARKSSKVKKG